jgi:hypothetical protein
MMQKRMPVFSRYVWQTVVLLVATFVVDAVAEVGSMIGTDIEDAPGYRGP